MALAAELGQYECRNITYRQERFPVFWERAHGVNVWDVDGNRFLDLTSGFGVSSLGYQSPAVVSAGRDQLGQLHHAMGDVHPSAVKVGLCRELSRWTFERWGAGVGKSILTNSGGEAVEAALKTAWLSTGKRGVVSFGNGYHGLGYGALTVSGLAEFRRPFQSQLADISWTVPFPSGSDADLQTTERQLRDLLDTREIGAILTEPIQGRGGVVVPPEGFLPLLRKLADEFGILLILDEIYTGFYRTGVPFACDRWQVVPDLLCLGKALTNGFPLAACIGKATVMDSWPASTGEALHTSTFLGNPVGCRMALAALKELERADRKWDLIEKGSICNEVLASLQLGPVRGAGLLWGVELADAALAGRLVVEGLDQGLILLTGGPGHNVLTLTPPFPITEAELREAARLIQRLTSK